MFFVWMGLASLAGAASLDRLVAKGDALDAKRKNGEALAVFLEADRDYPNRPEVLRRIARQYAQEMDAAGADRDKLGALAVEFGRRAVTAGPDNAQAHLALAIVYGKVAFLQPPGERLKFSASIKSETEKSLALDPGNDLAWHVLGRWNYELANLGRPMRFLAETLYGKLPEASNEQALACFRKAVALKPGSLANQAELGRTLAALNRKDEARAALEKALAMPSREKDDEETKSRARRALAALD